MLSTLNSLLPSALQPLSQPSGASQPAAPKETDPPDDSSATTEGHDGDSMAGVNEMGVRRKEKRGANETFIIVRPPPSKSNHPLNLQVQLVPPSAKERARRDSIESNATNGQDLRRTTSNRSDNGSVYSSYSTATSVASVSSTSTASSGRRMIIPLYNLQAHNVMTNVIADAGTDAKIAKFYKRGMEVIGLAVLEPTEIYGNGGNPTVMEAPAGSPSITPEPGHTPQSSQLSLASSGHEHPPTPTPEPRGAPATGAKKLFGRFFKKKDVPTTPSAPTTPKSASFGTISTPRPSKRASLLHPPGAVVAPSEPTPILMPAVLGIQPTLSAAIFPPTGRPDAYTWVVRRWLKGAHDSVLGNVVAGVLGTALASPSGPGALVELRFEWRKGAKGGKRGRRSGSTNGRGKRSTSRGGGDRTSVIVTSSNAPSTTSLVSNPRSRSAGRKERHRVSGVPAAAAGDTLAVEGTEDPDPTPRMPTDVPPVLSSVDDDGDESDPEDSETPWTCTLVAKRAAHGPLPVPTDGSSPADNAVRIKVASLAPTPHHPKVVAALKVPFPLPDVGVDALVVRRRFVTPAGVARPAAERAESAGSNGSRGARAPEGLVLTAEEIKDIVSSTAMWLVCREGIGGVGRVARKGDGWRIRA